MPPPPPPPVAGGAITVILAEVTLLSAEVSEPTKLTSAETEISLPVLPAVRVAVAVSLLPDASESIVQSAVDPDTVQDAPAMVTLPSVAPEICTET